MDSAVPTRLRHFGIALWMVSAPANAQDAAPAEVKTLPDMLTQTRTVWQKGLQTTAAEILRTHDKVQSCGTAADCKLVQQQCQTSLQSLSGSAAALQRAGEVYGGVRWLMNDEMRQFYGANQQMVADTIGVLRRVQEKTGGLPCQKLQPGG